MPIVYDGPVLPDDLTTFVRGVPQPQQYILDQVLPNRYVNDNRVDVGQITRVNRTARFRAYDAPLHRTQRDTAQVTTVQLPPLSDTLQMGELERIRLEQARTGGSNQQAFINAVYNDAEQLTRNVQNRMELARGDLLTDGKFTMLTASGEPSLEADFGVPGANFVTAGILWSTVATADPIGDINTWVTYYIGLNGYAPGGMYISRQTQNQLLTNASIRVQAGTILGSALMVTRTALDTVIDQRGLPPILGVYDALVDVDGVSTRTVAANKVVFVPPAGQPFGRTVWGVTATALELVEANLSEMSFEEAPGIVGVVEKDGPPYRQYDFVDAVGMPVLDNPRGLLVATVA
jgi:hypothetical protein